MTDTAYTEQLEAYLDMCIDCIIAVDATLQDEGTSETERIQSVHQAHETILDFLQEQGYIEVIGELH